MATAVRVVHSGGTINFDQMDVSEVRRVHVQKTDRYWDQDNYFHQYLIGKDYDIFYVTIKNVTEDILTDTETLYDAIDSTTKQPEVLTLYWKYLISSGTSTYVMMDRNSYRKNYYKSRKVRDKITLIFVQTNTP